MSIGNSSVWIRTGGGVAAVALFACLLAAQGPALSAGDAGHGEADAPAACSPICPGKLSIPATVPESCAAREPQPLARVGFRQWGGHVVVPVSINGSRALNMVLDTGMSAPIVLLGSMSLAEETGLKDGQPTMIGGAGGQEPVAGSLFSGIRVSVGDAELSEQTVITLPGSGSPSPCIRDGVIGKSIFDRYLVEIDFEAAVLSIHEGAVSDTNGFVSLPLDLSVGVPKLAAEIEMDDGRKTPVVLDLDLGARHALSLFFNEAKGIAAPAQNLATVVGRGMQGEIRGQIGRVRALHLGALALRDVVTSFTDIENFSSCAVGGRGMDGNLGIEVLNRFRVILDYPGSRLLLKPNSMFERPFEYNMAGLSLEPQDDGSYLVRAVTIGSPGEEAGIARGDRIVGIDGEELTRGSYDERAERFQQDGATLIVRLAREGRRFDRTLKLRRLI